jgi:putative Ca2+/H+ antiporter (TMEM165/GDT1 family)
MNFALLTHPTLNLPLFGSTFLLIFLAELPDKTALATILMASRYKPLGVFAGVAAAYVIQNLVAVFFGGLIALLPPSFVHASAGVLFLIFAFLIWRHREELNEKFTPKQTFLKTAVSSFTVIFIAEWGDLTQLAAVTLIARWPKDSWTIFLASTLALWICSGLMIWIGRKARKLFNPVPLQKFAALVFMSVGFLLLAGFWDK